MVTRKGDRGRLAARSIIPPAWI